MFNKLKSKFAYLMVDWVSNNKIFRQVPDKQIINTEYFLIFGKLPDLTNPKTFSEKLQWIKLYGNLEKYSEFADKFKVREFIKKNLGSDYLIPLLGVWKSFDEINFDELPNQFVLKATHGSGYIFICRDKKLLDKNRLKSIVDCWMAENFYEKTRENQYKGYEPKIIAEKYLEDRNGQLTDYKVFCSNGEPKIVKVFTDRFTNKKFSYMNLNWERLPIYEVPLHLNSKKVVEKPENLDEMLLAAKKLSENFPFVRVDMYSVQGKTYFGELTFTPANGFSFFTSPKTDRELGDLIDLSKF